MVANGDSTATRRVQPTHIVSDVAATSATAKLQVPSMLSAASCALHRAVATGSTRVCSAASRHARHMSGTVQNGGVGSPQPLPSSALEQISVASPVAPENIAVRRVRVYTRTGDKGSSSLYNGERRPKDDACFAALGDVDELNACLGLARVYCAALGAPLDAQLTEIQSRLLDVGSAIATPPATSTAVQLDRAAFPAHCTADLERWIDAMDDELPPLRNFILPVRLDR